ncbi:KH domain-containing protein HEN4-like [Salvia divinorum]|uniref:KH domain-containing protein HEN4-like n=1 Tax=Salvia divinorum TaxID=28513 RepID=A0ABD1ILX3_SALDI
MEETAVTTPFPPQKIPKSGPKHPATNHRSSANAKQSHPDAPVAGQAAYRLLCHVHTAGGVIGNSGSIIKQLETLTGSKIRFEEGLPNCHERVVNIVGEGALERKISVGGPEEENTVSVSKAQEGLIRVFERVLEVEGNTGKNDNVDDDEHRNNNNNGLIVCRLLAPTVQIGALMGKGGKIVAAIRKSTGAKIRVFKKEQVPPCAAPEEELIQIVGGLLAVKKALLAVSRRLQDRTLGEGAPGHISTHGASQNSYSDFSVKNNTSALPVSDTAAEHCSVDHSLSADTEKYLNVDDKSSLKKVIFRFLCSSGIAGGVIGKGANIVKYLEKETGASIKFASPVSGSRERVAIISSLESPNPLYSPAQIAIVRVFSRCVEVSLDQGVIVSFGCGESVSARILVASSQLSSIVDGDGKLASDICVASGAEIQLMGADLPDFAGVGDNVVQITGDYENVKSALFQLAGRLRENFFSRIGYKGAGSRRSLYSAVSSSSPTGGEAAFSTQSAQLSRLSRIDELDHLGFVQKSSSSWLPGLQWEQANNIESHPRPVDGSKGTFPSGFKRESNIVNEGSEQKVEVVVPSEKFGSVYGEDGSNMTRLREISSAVVTVVDPSPGEGSGKVIISGTPECIRIAQSLLQAFISF